MNKKQAYEFIEQNSDIFCTLSDKVWDYAETAFEEFQSAECFCEALKQFGFEVKQNVGDIPAAFVGTWGNGYPVIGFLGEYDALAELSQEAGIAKKSPIEKGGNGHGCGHNLLGAGALAAAVAVKDYLEKTGKSGTIKFFGCPGEEGGSGKAFMAREGVFDGLDLAFCWHPMNINGVFDVSTLANYQISYEFTGRSAHAAATPHLGRSALDALELMNVGVQFLREHVIQEARIHYAITNAGGFSPNVVQPKAEVLYLIRAPRITQIEEIYQRINKIAWGMALATETEVEIKFIKACADIVPNKVLSGLLHKNMLSAPKISYTEQDYAFAEALDKTMESPPPLQVLTNVAPEDINNCLTQMQDKAIYEEVLPFYPDREVPVSPGSTDVGDVSYIAPTGQVVTSCWTFKTPPHTWQSVAIGKSGIAHKGFIYAAQALAGAAIDALEDDSIIQAAKEEFNNRLGGNAYKCPIPPEIKPQAVSKL